MKPTHELTRASLILRIQDAEDKAAWDEFATIYGPVVFSVAMSRGFQAADAENLVQEVFLAVANSISNWLERDDRGSFRAWLLHSSQACCNSVSPISNNLIRCHFRTSYAYCK
jgi:RNA polymerase sigma-70 factor (ECF subfamily)